MRDFAKIVRASSGQQVLFYVETDNDAEPARMVLRGVAHACGIEASHAISFADEEAAYRALDKMDEGCADALVRLAGDFSLEEETPGE
jgi:hypothetical protein